jgi:hypothetical protein
MSRTASSDLLKKSVGPRKPEDVRGSLTTNPTTRLQQNIPNNTPVTQTGKLQSEVSEATNIHNTLTNLLPDTSSIKSLGQALAATTQNMSTEGIALITPVLEDYRNIALDNTQTTSEAPVYPETSQVVSYLSTLSSDILNTLSSSANQLYNQVQSTSNQELKSGALLVTDILAGYPKLVGKLGTLAEQLASQSPRILLEISNDMKVPSISGFTQALSDFSKEIYISYATVNSQVLAAHDVVSKNATKKQRTVNTLREIASTSYIISQSIYYFNNQNYNVSQITATIENSLISYVESKLNQFLQNLEVQLLNKLNKRTDINEQAKNQLKQILSSL